MSILVALQHICGFSFAYIKAYDIGPRVGIKVISRIQLVLALCRLG